jgi:hypothetical protein
MMSDSRSTSSNGDECGSVYAILAAYPWHDDLLGEDAEIISYSKTGELSGTLFLRGLIVLASDEHAAKESTTNWAAGIFGREPADVLVLELSRQKYQDSFRRLLPPYEGECLLCDLGFNFAVDAGIADQVKDVFSTVVEVWTDPDRPVQTPSVVRGG